MEALEDKSFEDGSPLEGLGIHTAALIGGDFNNGVKTLDFLIVSVDVIVAIAELIHHGLVPAYFVVLICFGSCTLSRFRASYKYIGIYT